MSSDRATLNATTRTDFGSRISKRLRRDGKVPGVVYSDGKEATTFQVESRDARVILGEGHALFDLHIEGSDAVPVVVKEQQHHPVRGDLQHLDLQQVDLNQAIQAEVAVELTGDDVSPGVKQGGVLEHVTREVTVEALPTDIPDSITLDVSEMEINDTLTLEQLVAPEGVTLIADDPAEVTLVTLSPPRVEEEPEVDLEAEPEVVGEGEEGGEEAAEGEEGGDEGSSGEE
ncbi:MAG TPA: 50S ribosomal protein L25 [Solirubrobacterales bacterium]|jgi:large subunit ribosomal protein L25|nr:50S ribosomal protein L25 [Solirubrobacterales bacterium]HMU26025.1 50S ribosomal protein L25 [Solirubrobacterales bacterium]HMX70593.1 50S ribosomal protein L25 [Solirubrobacterales bacterium]HMY25577.1 50S ribosomal protein L25 [Solirubrobacterales bacterium]HNA24954.1 50S ribosomal protein L25 [Solirubrobacterales bacterium]